MHRPFARRRLLTGLVLLGTAAAALLLPTTPAASTVTTECPPGLKVRPSNSPRTILVRDTATDERLRVRVTLTGPSFTIEPVGRDVLDDASWCLKAGKRFATGTGTEGTTTLTNKNGVPLPIRFLVVYSVTTFTDPPTGTCWDSTIENVPDLHYAGPINVRFNVEVVGQPTDGTCSGPGVFLRTLVRADQPTIGRRPCQEITAGNPALGNLRDLGNAAAPANFWRCASPFDPPTG